MLLSRSCEAALAALAFLDPAGPSAPGREARELARLSGEPGPYLAKVLQRLARAGLLRSKRGRSGGFVLARPAAEITLADVVLAAEGAASLETLLAPPRGPAAGILEPVTRRLVTTLRKTTLAALGRKGLGVKRAGRPR